MPAQEKEDDLRPTTKKPYKTDTYILRDRRKYKHGCKENIHA